MKKKSGNIASKSESSFCLKDNLATVLPTCFKFCVSNKFTALDYKFCFVKSFNLVIETSQTNRDMRRVGVRAASNRNRRSEQVADSSSSHEDSTNSVSVFVNYFVSVFFNFIISVGYVFLCVLSSMNGLCIICRTSNLQLYIITIIFPAAKLPGALSSSF